MHAQVGAALGALSADLWYHASTWLLATYVAAHRKAHAAAGAGVWLYRVTQPGHTKHGADAPLWSGPPADARGGRKRPVEPEESRRLPGGESSADASTPPSDGRAAHLYLCQFARTGDPNGPGLPRWDPHEAAPPSATADGEDDPLAVLPERLRGSARYMALGPSLGMDELDAPTLRRFAFVSEYLHAAPWLAPTAAAPELEHDTVKL